MEAALAAAGTTQLGALGPTLSSSFNILHDEPLAVGCIGAFVLLIVLVLVWVFVIAPRRSRKLLAEFAQLGYVETDRAAPELVSALDSLAPIYLEGSTRFQEGTRQTLNALVRKSGSDRRYLVNLAQTDWEGTDARTTWRTVVLESKSLAVDTEFSVRLNAREAIGIGREERFGFQKVEVRGLSPDFAATCSVYSKGGGAVTLSSRLQDALIDASRSIRTTSRSNTRFGPTGWGISASDIWLDRKALRTLLDVADRISGAL
jgi:hypothetical protein